MHGQKNIKLYKTFIYEFVIRIINAVMVFLPLLISIFFFQFLWFYFYIFEGGLYELKIKVLSEEYFRPSVRPAVIQHQRLIRLQGIHEIPYSCSLQKLRDKHEFPENRLCDGHSVPQGVNEFITKFYCFTVHFNSLNLTCRLMLFYIQ